MVQAAPGSRRGSARGARHRQAPGDAGAEWQYPLRRTVPYCSPRGSTDQGDGAASLPETDLLLSPLQERRPPTRSRRSGCPHLPGLRRHLHRQPPTTSDLARPTAAASRKGNGTVLATKNEHDASANTLGPFRPSRSRPPREPSTPWHRRPSGTVLTATNPSRSSLCSPPRKPPPPRSPTASPTSSRSDACSDLRLTVTDHRARRPDGRRAHNCQVAECSRSSSLLIASRSTSCCGPSLNCSSLHRSGG